MNKKILTLLIVLITVSTIAIVGAADTQTIGDVEFNIPEGYVYDADSVNLFLQAFDDEKEIDDVGVFKNSADDIFAILVYNETTDQDYPDDYNIENKTISEKNGTLATAPSGENIVFMYNTEDDKFIIIQAVDETTIEEAIK